MNSMVSQGRFELPTFPLGGPFSALPAVGNPRVYGTFSPLESMGKCLYSCFCTHPAPMSKK